MVRLASWDQEKNADNEKLEVVKLKDLRWKERNLNLIFSISEQATMIYSFE